MDKDSNGGGGAVSWSGSQPGDGSAKAVAQLKGPNHAGRLLARASDSDRGYGGGHDAQDDELGDTFVADVPGQGDVNWAAAADAAGVLHTNPAGAGGDSDEDEDLLAHYKSNSTQKNGALHADLDSETVDEEEDEEIDYGTLNWRKEMWAQWDMAWPVSLSTVCRLCLTSIDTAFVGHLGTKQLSAAALAGSWGWTLSCLAMGPPIVLNTLGSQAYGAQNYRLVGEWFQLALVFVTLMSMPIAMGYVYTGDVLSLFVSDPLIITFASRFGQLSALSILPQLIYTAIQQYMQAQNVVQPATFVSILSIGVAIGANRVLIYGVGSWEGWGFDGSPIATFAASLFQPVVFCIYCFTWKGMHRRTWKGWTSEAFTGPRVKEFVYMAIPMALTLALEEWVYQIILLSSGHLGASDVGAMGIIFQLWNIAWSLFWGFSLAVQVRIAQHLGAGQAHAAKVATLVGLLLVIVTIIGTGGPLLAVRGQIGQVFLGSGNTPVDVDTLLLVPRLVPALVATFSLSSIVLWGAAVLEGLALATRSMLVAGVASWFFVLPLSWYFGFHEGHGAEGLWWGAALGEGCKAVLSVGMVVITNWDKAATDAQKRSEVEALAGHPAGLASPPASARARSPGLGQSGGVTAALSPHSSRPSSTVPSRVYNNGRPMSPDRAMSHVASAGGVHTGHHAIMSNSNDSFASYAHFNGAQHKGYGALLADSTMGMVGTPDGHSRAYQSSPAAGHALGTPASSSDDHSDDSGDSGADSDDLAFPRDKRFERKITFDDHESD